MPFLSIPFVVSGPPLQREEPWIITGQEQYAPQLVSFVCPRCENEIRLDDSQECDLSKSVGGSQPLFRL